SAREDERDADRRRVTRLLGNAHRRDRAAAHLAIEPARRRCPTGTECQEAQGAGGEERHQPGRLRAVSTHRLSILAPRAGLDAARAARRRPSHSIEYERPTV